MITTELITEIRSALSAETQGEWVFEPSVGLMVVGEDGETDMLPRDNMTNNGTGIVLLHELEIVGRQLAKSIVKKSIELVKKLKSVIMLLCCEEQETKQ